MAQLWIQVGILFSENTDPYTGRTQVVVKQVRTASLTHIIFLHSARTIGAQMADGGHNSPICAQMRPVTCMPPKSATQVTSLHSHDTGVPGRTCTADREDQGGRHAYRRRPPACSVTGRMHVCILPWCEAASRASSLAIHAIAA
jgi:hypothetical protein